MKMIRYAPRRTRSTCNRGDRFGTMSAPSSLQPPAVLELKMALSFPNRSRSYDATRRAVRFWGHDSVIEYAFLISGEALKRARPAARLDQSGLLSVFDANRDLSYALDAADF